MKSLAQFEKDLGNDAQLGGSVGVEGELLKLELHATYPIMKIVEPATKALDDALDQLKKAIPGTWDDAQIDAFKLVYKEQLLKAIRE